MQFNCNIFQYYNNMRFSFEHLNGPDKDLPNAILVSVYKIDEPSL